MGKQIDHTLTCAAQSVGAVQAALCTYDLPNDSVAYVELIVTGRDTGNGEGYTLKRMIAFKQVAGIGAQIGNASDTFAAVASQVLSAASVAISIVNATISVTATGVVGRTIDWYAVMKVQVN
jgi:hypothetical protein